MFRPFYDHICHWLLSHSRHGTHSPFVYRLVDEVVYNDQSSAPQRIRGIRPARVNALINRILEFWLKDEVDIREYILIKSDADYLDKFNETLPKAHPGTLLIFEGIYQNKQHKTNWKLIIANEEVRVSIDLFYIGLVFFRQGQAKEHFKIRY